MSDETLPMRSIWLRLSTVLVFLASLWNLPAGPAAGETSRPLSPYRPGEILVKLRDGVIAQDFTTLFASPALRVRGALSADGLLYLSVPVGEERGWATRLAQDRRVVYAQPNWIYQLDAVPDDDLFPQQWGLPTIGAPTAWDITTGDPRIVVAVVDSGVDLNHPDLAGAIWTNPHPTMSPPDLHGWNFISNTADVRDDMDRSLGSPVQSHGTHVSGIIAARINNGIGIAGVAGTITIMPVKSGDWQGQLTSASVYQGIRYAVDHGARVINLSFGSYQPDAAVADAVAYALSKNAVVVAAAGNCGLGCPGAPEPNPVTYPASLPGVLAVSNLARSGVRHPTSEFGPYIAVAAPGQTITSTLYAISTDTHFYGALSGTSMAAPHVSALAALILSVNPDLTNAEVARIITSTASLAPSRNDDLGYGVINVEAALRSTPHRLRIQPSTLDIMVSPRAITPAQLTNPGTSARTWTAQTTTPWLTIGPVTGTVPSYVDVSIDRSKFPTPSIQTGFITITSQLTNTVVSAQVVTVTARWVGGYSLSFPSIANAAPTPSQK